MFTECSLNTQSGFRLKEKAADIMETLEKDPDEGANRVTAAEQWEAEALDFAPPEEIDLRAVRDPNRIRALMHSKTGRAPLLS